jgi:hypothetical protein
MVSSMSITATFCASRHRRFSKSSHRHQLLLSSCWMTARTSSRVAAAAANCCILLCLTLLLSLSLSSSSSYCTVRAAAFATTTTTTTTIAARAGRLSSQQQPQNVRPMWCSVFSSSSSSSSLSSLSRSAELHKKRRTAKRRGRGRSVATNGLLFTLQMASSNGDDDDDEINSDDNSDKLGFMQRIDSGKSLVVGAIVGSFALVIPELFHQLVLPASANNINGLAQFEFDVDMGALMSGLFAICYRYCIRMDENPQLAQGVVGAFGLTRTLSRVFVPTYCVAPMLRCGAPLGYLDWNMLTQIVLNGVESFVMFGATAMAMEYCMERKWISKFPG